MATITSPARAPFGVVDNSRLKGLTNIKNVQNALSSPSVKNLKRHHDSTPDMLDTENIDPDILFSPSKKAKGNYTDIHKPSQFVLKKATPVPSFSKRQIITPKKLVKNAADIKPVSFSAPAAAPAGRSPKSKRVGILSRRRTSGYGRVDPPACGLNTAPFSIDAALSGTVSSYKPAEPLSIDEAIPKGWQFEIHEDTPDEELGNLVQHSTQTLDISDDESRAREIDLRGKENIPPDTMAFVPVSRRDAMTDERTPLGDLEASDFYAEGCDANSYIIVDGVNPKEQSILVEEKAKETPTPSPSDASNQDVWKQLLAQVDQKQEAAQTPIEIWESESAKGDETAELENVEVVVTTSLEQDLAAADAREEQALAQS